MADYAVHLATWAGSSLTDRGAFATLARDNGYNLVQPRNGIGDFVFTYSVWDSMAYNWLSVDQAMGRGEIRVLRDSTLIWQGITVAFDVDEQAQTVTAHCRSLEQYFAWLLFGKAERDSLLSNGDFEASLTDWTAHGTTATVEATLVNSGTKAAKLNGAGHITQTATGITHSYDPGLAPRLAAYVYVPASVGAAVGDDFIIARLVANNGTREYIETITIGDLDRFDAYTRVSQDILLVADDTWDVEVRLEGSAAGLIYWDDVLFTFNDAVTVAYPGDDLQVLVANIISHAQDTGFGKKDLGITVDGTATGIILIKGYAFADHENIWDALQDLCKEFDCDIWIDLDRVLHVEPKRGGTVSGMDRELAVSPNEPARTADFTALTDIAETTIAADTSQQRSTIIAGAESSDFAREEAGASHPGFGTNGFGTTVVSEEYVAAPPSAKVRDLQLFADNLLARRSDVAVFPALTYLFADAGAAEPGDVCEVTIDIGSNYISDDYRIETWALNLVTDTVQVAFDKDYTP